uniref:Peptidase metallopeptidase domain-containing protein n=1 Tax=Kalanchoe fedtschenkoi TaxID=63787 RepID=A0A7N0UDZ4_KALFE
MAHFFAYLLLSHLLLLLGSSSWTDAARPIHDHDMHTHYYKPVKPFNHLAGSRKGDDVAGVRDVKGYLQRFGYLNYPKGKALDDAFDDSLEQAILTYQDFFQLNKTGFLDTETVSLMSKPRCGSPDIVPGERGQLDHRRNYQTHYRLYPGRPRRASGQLYVAIRPSVPAELVDAISQAFTDWEPHVPLVFVKSLREPINAAADIRAGFYSGEHGDGSPFDGPGNVLAHASPGGGSVLHFDVDEKWAVGAVDDAMDVVTVARHEIGHLLGLAHSPVRDALMYPSVGAGEVKEIGEDDVAGVTALYYGG